MTNPKLNALIETFCIDAFGMTKEQAIAAQCCIECKECVVDDDGYLDDTHFHTMPGKREYFISGLCELCFDKLFKEE